MNQKLINKRLKNCTWSSGVRITLRAEAYCASPSSFLLIGI
ncbi:MAG: hypothetical protein ACXWUF_13535 [Methylomagnum sp.]